MPEIIDHVAYLSQEIGPRPAGTEEEQQAALYITEQLQKEAGLSAVIEDFNGTSNADVPRAICCGVSLVAGLLAIFLPVIVIPAIVITLIAALLFAAEIFDRPVLSKVLARGVSQNIIAKYEPGYTAESGGTRRRKIVLVARYDSGKVRPELTASFIGLLPILRWVNFGAMVFIPLLLVFRATVFLHATGVTEIVLNVLMGIAVLLAIFPLVSLISHKLAVYNEAANSNASGVAVLLEIARRIGRGRVSEAELAARLANATIHGEDAARAAGLVPEGAQLVYAAANVQAPETIPQSEQARLASAKAAIAALTGKPVAGRGSTDISEHLVQVKEPPLPVPTDEDYHALRDETRDAFMTIPPDTIKSALSHAADLQEKEGMAAQAVFAAAASAGAASRYSAVPKADDSVPDWFKNAQERAKKPKETTTEIQRSRYAEVADINQADSQEHVDSVESAQPLGNYTPQQVDSPEITISMDGDAALTQDHNTFVEEHRDSDVSFGSTTSMNAAAGATQAMPPLDMNDLRMGIMPTLDEVSMPAFLNPLNVQAQKLEERGEVIRTENRVEVTDASGFTPTQAKQSISDASRRRPITLPDIGVSSSGMPSISELTKQRAPLAEAGTSGTSAAKSLLTLLPSIDPVKDTFADDQAGFVEGSRTTRLDLRSALPSLSGAIPRPNDSAVSTAGSFVAAGATGAFAPVGDELLENVAPEDIYVDDADDSSYEDDFTESGAFAGTGYVEMPKSRAHRLFDKLRFRKEKEIVDPSPQEWLAVDDTFDAREVGAARGGWESFREDDQAVETDTMNGFVDDQQSVYQTNSAAPYFPLEDDFSVDDLEDDEIASPFAHKNSRWNGGGFSRLRMDRTNEPAEEGHDIDREHQEVLPLALEENVSSELEQIYHFRNPDISTEVWFVALGSELAHHGGMRAFLAEHNQDLRGAIIVDLDSLGAGDLCMVESEGRYRKVKTSSRMKRYTKKASQATGISIGSVSIPWEDSAASVALKQGFQALHIVGMESSKPAFFAQGDDVLENIEEETLVKNTDFIMEMLKNI